MNRPQSSRLALALSLFTVITAAATIGPAWAQTGDKAEKAAQFQDKMSSRFKEADVNQDGKLTREEAAKMPKVLKNFDAIDTGKKGYVTQDDITAYVKKLASERGK